MFERWRMDNHYDTPKHKVRKFGTDERVVIILSDDSPASKQRETSSSAIFRGGNANKRSEMVASFAIPRRSTGVWECVFSHKSSSSPWRSRDFGNFDTCFR